MDVYFVKATYTNNVYKISDFFASGNYKLVAGKKLDINIIPDDGVSQFITSKLILPDTTSIRDHTHIIVPSFNKIYKITAIDYINIQQALVIVDDDPFIGNYQELKSKEIILNRTNDDALFRGVNDISDMTLKETVETKVFASTAKTGRWALIFMQIDKDKTRYGLSFGQYSGQNHEWFNLPADVKTKYPEVETLTPSLYSYFQKIVETTAFTLQCVYDGTKLLWVIYLPNITIQEVYFDISDAVGGRVSDADITNIIIALPYEAQIMGTDDVDERRLLSYQDFNGPIDAGVVIDIKIVDDILLPIDSVNYDFTVGTGIMKKEIITAHKTFTYLDVFPDDTTVTKDTNFQLLTFNLLNTEIVLDPGYIVGDIKPIDAEPFNKYDLYIFGKKFTIPYYLTNDIHLLIAMNSGVINYTVFYNDKRNILGSGSFTHSLRYQVDKLDQFYNENPTYKDQFFVKLGVDAFKTVGAAAIGGSVIPGLGTLAGAGVGLIGAGVDAGLSLVNLNFQEKSLKLQPDQVFGEISEVTMQLLNIFGIYFVKRISENSDLMKTEYNLRGFPISKSISIDNLTNGSSDLFFSSKIIYGETKLVIKNAYTTAFINQKLTLGVILVP